VAHLRTRAKEFATPVPSFLNRKPQEAIAPAFKRKFRKLQHYMVDGETGEDDSQEEESTQLYMHKGHPKGLGKGKGKDKGKKGKPGKGGFRDHQHRHVAPQLSFDGSKGKGKGKPFPKGKGETSQYGNRGKGKSSAPPRSDSSASSHTSITCGFCHK
jgi:hypothetical protein